MGVYDTLIDGDIEVQVKCLTSEFKVFNTGDEVPSPLPDMTIVCPNYGEEEYIFAIIKDHKFVRLTKNSNEVVPPYIDKWGTSLPVFNDFENPFEAILEALKES